MTFKSDLEIASSAHLKKIDEIAALIGLSTDDLVVYGDYKAKIKLDSIRKILTKKQGKLILVSAITPTPAGEGKTTVSIGLTQALRKIGKNAIVAIREPSLGPCFGVKGGAAGGGYSQVLPMEDINLHFTGDIHAVSASHNLIAAALDNHIHYRFKNRISIRDTYWKRVMDMNDRSLREIVIGLKKNGFARESGFEITAASEIMAILCLSKDYEDLKQKIGNILLAQTLEDEKPFFARDLHIAGAATALLKDALLPNLVQTIEHGPALIHGGPFANIAQGANSILATKLALSLSDYVVTEAGFGFDLGAEKFFDIVSRYGQFSPQAVVLVASARALKMHGGVKKSHLQKDNPSAIKIGACNLEKHIENAKKFNVEVMVAINKFQSDTLEEIKVIEEICNQNQVISSVVEVREKGGLGGVDLAQKLVSKLDHNTYQPKHLYEWTASVEDKINTVAKEIYGAKNVHFEAKAKSDLELIYNNNLNNLPVCIAKTQNSLSDDPKKIGRPQGFTLTVREIIISSGAGFLVPLTGEIMRMPGLPQHPSANDMDIDANGNISGLF